MTSKAELREKILELQTQIINLMNTNETLETWRASWIAQFDDEKGSLQSIHNAWTQLLQMLEADHQTMAVQRLEYLLKNKDADKAILAINQAKASADESVRIHKLAIRQLEFQRDSAQKEYENQNFDYANTKARCEELEELLRDMRPVLFEDLGDTARHLMHERVVAMLGDDL